LGLYVSSDQLRTFEWSALVRRLEPPLRPRAGGGRPAHESELGPVSPEEVRRASTALSPVVRGNTLLRSALARLNQEQETRTLRDGQRVKEGPATGVLTSLQAPFELQSRRSVKQLDPTEAKVGSDEIATRNIQR